jgi:hypothetical protein
VGCVSPLSSKMECLNSNAPERLIQANHLIEIHRHLWESYVSKSTECRLLGETHQQLQIINMQLCQEQKYLRCRQADQELLVAFSIDALQTAKGILKNLFEICDNHSLGAKSLVG